MSYGRVYTWVPDSREELGGRVEKAIVPLSGFAADTGSKPRLSGRLVCVRNGGSLYVPDEAIGDVRAVPVGNAEPDENGDFLFEPGQGGTRMDKVARAEPESRWRYIQASHFGEVNTYYHLHRIASYVEELLDVLKAPRLRQVVAVVNARHAATEAYGIRDGIRGTRHWLPLQGAHYRLPSRRYDTPEPNPLSPDGEIHLGPGWQLLADGALVRAAGCPYRANASQNAGIIYHEYGHHLNRHTADFRCNARKFPQHQSNRKTALVGFRNVGTLI